MIVHAEVNQDGSLRASLPPQFRGRKVVLSVVHEENHAASNWLAISAALREIDKLPLPHRHIDDILADLRTMRESA
ncbi:MAG: hypothetical protein RL122_2075 [Pseudomonadota bacterium]|jgi:hypothetical protein